MAQFKFIGHSNGAAPSQPADSTVTIRGNCQVVGTETYEMEVLPDEVFSIPDDWDSAISALTASSRNGQPCYERLS